MNVYLNISTFWAVMITIAFGLTIELFFQLIKYRDSLNSRYPVPATAYGQLVDASNYISVSQYLSQGRRRWVNYFLFRLLPPFIILVLLCGILNKYFYIDNPLPFLLLGAGVSLLARDVWEVFRTDLVSEKILHIVNINFVLLLAFGVSLLSEYVSLSYIVPSIDGLVDNLWSSLLVAILVVFYLKSTNMRYADENSQIKDITVSNYVASSYMKIKNKYSDDIIDACDKYRCSVPLLYSILVYENMNRPAWIRIVENQLVRVFKLKLTVGIAQVRSDKPLTNKESIYRAAKILGDTAHISVNDKSQELIGAIYKYNKGDKYANSIYVVLDKLKQYASSIFQEI